MRKLLLKQESNEIEQEILHLRDEIYNDNFFEIFEENNILFSETAMAGDSIEVLAPLVSLADKIKNNKLTLPIFSIVYFVKPKFSKSNGKEIEIAHSTNLRELKKEFFLLVNNKKDIQLAFSKIYLKNQKTNEVLLEYNPEQDAIIFYENENIKKVLNLKENKVYKKTPSINKILNKLQEVSYKKLELKWENNETVQVDLSSFSFSENKGFLQLKTVSSNLSISGELEIKNLNLTSFEASRFNLMNINWYFENNKFYFDSNNISFNNIITFILLIIKF